MSQNIYSNVKPSQQEGTSGQRRVARTARQEKERQEREAATKDHDEDRG